MTPEKYRPGARKFVAAGLTAVCLTLAACDSALLTCSTDCELDPGADTSGNTLIDAATNEGNFSTLLAVLETAGLQQILSDADNNYTLFAPTDAAFATLSDAELVSLQADQTALIDTLLYHVLPGSVNAESATSLAGTLITMQNNKAAALNLVDGNLQINNATITKTDIVASNGIIHAIDAVLTPPVATVPVNIVETVTNAGDFTTLLSILETSGLDQVLANEAQTFTLFAPTDDAFSALDQSTIDALLADGTLLNDTLLYHVLPDAVDLASALKLAAKRSTIRMQNGSDAQLSLSGEQLVINSSGVIIADLMASNGIIHAIDTVLTPLDGAQPAAADLISTLAKKQNYSTLLDLLESSGLTATLANAETTFTLFAPTNAAFDAIGSAQMTTYSNDAAALQSLLEGHLLPDSVIDAASAVDGTDLTMVNGAVRTISATDNTIMLDSATVIEADITTANGVIHGIDAVLVP